MNPVGGHTYGLSPDACQTEIDGVAWEAYQRVEQPGYLSAQDDWFFKQTSHDLLAYTWDEDSNVGAFEETDEQETLQDTDTFLGNTKTKKQQIKPLLMIGYTQGILDGLMTMDFFVLLAEKKRSSLPLEEKTSLPKISRLHCAISL